MIRITCYGKTEEYPESERENLILKYFEGMMYSEGSEQSRYVNILEGLQFGDTEITDEI